MNNELQLKPMCAILAIHAGNHLHTRNKNLSFLSCFIIFCDTRISARLGKGPKKSAKSVIFDQSGEGRPKPNPYCIVLVDS